ncbi:hypothetical protein [Planctomicrobium sp. SH527]|uniref:hypothetical protein n=1 Tax=Planctomicrobium sp. SH527 TaxID=3448123 RepID=UPI003F5AE95B
MLLSSAEMGQGTNWVVSNWPFLVEKADGSIALVRGTTASLWFDLSSGSYVGRYGSLTSFFQYHSRSDWNVIFLDVGCSESVRKSLERIGTCVPYSPHRIPNSHGLVFPAALARLASLAEHIPEQGIYLYVDTDSLFFASMEPVLRQFRRSGLPLAIAIEDDPGFWPGQMQNSWLGEIPPEFLRRSHWQNRPLLNTGLLLAQGTQVRAAAQFARQLYRNYSDRLQHAEQTILASLIYEWEIPYFPLPHHIHCFAREEYLEQDRPGVRYVDAAPRYLDHLVTMRHFCGRTKSVLRDFRTPLDQKYEAGFRQLQASPS